MTDFGGRARLVDASGNAIEVTYAATLDNEVPEALRSGARDILRKALVHALRRPPSAAALAGDTDRLSRMVTDNAAADLAQGDIIGTVSFTFLRVSPMPVRQPVQERETGTPKPQPPPPTNQTALATPALSDEDALPFQPGQAQPPPAVADAPPHEDAGETAFMPPLQIDDGAALPFDDGEALPDLPELTVEQYASLCVERTLSPGRESEVAERYQVLTEQALRALDQRFRHRFATEGELLQRYQQAYARYEAWLRNQKKQ